MRPRGPIKESDVAFGAKARDPAMGALPGYTELLGDMGDRARLVDDASNKQSPAVQVQTGISVGHEDLLVGEDLRHLH